MDDNNSLPPWASGSDQGSNKVGTSAETSSSPSGSLPQAADPLPGSSQPKTPVSDAPPLPVSDSNLPPKEPSAEAVKASDEPAPLGEEKSSEGPSLPPKEPVSPDSSSAPEPKTDLEEEVEKIISELPKEQLDRANGAVGAKVPVGSENPLAADPPPADLPSSPPASPLETSETGFSKAEEKELAVSGGPEASSVPELPETDSVNSKEAEPRLDGVEPVAGEVAPSVPPAPVETSQGEGGSSSASSFPASASFIPPSPKKPEPPKSGSAKKIILGVVVFLLVSASSAMAYFLLGGNVGEFGLQKRASTTCNYPDNPSHPCNSRSPGWSTCGVDPMKEGAVNRWGCDGSCNYVDLEDSWCEGTLRKECESSGNIKETIGGCEVDGGNPCDGKNGNVCVGQSNNDGSVSVLNCTGQAQNYTCQTNHKRLSTEQECGGATETNDWTGYSGLSLQPGETGSCSVSAGGNCDISQADILFNNSAICWDIAKDCSNCGSPPPSLTPIPETTPTGEPSATPAPVSCTSVQIIKNGSLVSGSTASLLPGDTVVVRVNFNGPVENVGAKIIKDGSVVWNKVGTGATSAGHWDSPAYTIPPAAAGSYSAQGFIKVGGNWQ